MREIYETLDQYLDDLDRIKEKVAEETRGLDASEVQAHFARSGKELERLTGKRLRVRRPRHRTRRRNKSVTALPLMVLLEASGCD